MTKYRIITKKPKFNGLPRYVLQRKGIFWWPILVVSPDTSYLERWLMEKARTKNFKSEIIKEIEI